VTAGELPGVRVVLDARPLQDPDRAPATARYLEGLLGAFDAAPLAGESFVLLLQSDLDDPTTRFERLPIAGRRLLPPTRFLGGAALAVDPFLLRGASLGAAWRWERSGAAGAVYHAAAGAAPVFARIPTVVTLLDLAPWELSRAFGRGPAGRFGQRLRTRLVRRAAAVLVGTEAVASGARRLLRLRRQRVRVVPLAPDPAFVGATPGAALDELRERLGLPARYLVYFGRYDARHDLTTLLRAVALLAGRPRPERLPADVPWPPRILLAGASPNDRAALARAASRFGVGDHLSYAPALPADRLATLVSGSRAVVHPAVSDAAGLAAINALAAGVPVVASAIGALPEVVGPAGILVEARNPDRLAEAISTAWSDDRTHGRLRAAAAERGAAARTWSDVAGETRRAYADVARLAHPGSSR
jgi:glycosyltransferase involved in cell wall biosynthesis